MRILSVIIAALLLAACQQTGPSTTAQGNAAEHPHLRFCWSAFAALQHEMLASLAEACRTRASETTLFDRCLRERIASAFDDSGEGRVNCAFHTGFGDFVDCIAMGNTFIDLRHRMTDTSPLPT